MDCLLGPGYPDDVLGSCRIGQATRNEFLGYVSIKNRANAGP